MGTRLNQRGFSLLGMSLAISLAMSFLIYTTPMITKAYDQVLSRATSERVRLVYDGAYNHYIENGSWPIDVSSLVSEGYLGPNAVETVWGTPITLAASGSNLLLSFSVPDNKFVQMIRGQLPAPTVVGTTITEQLAPPGQQVSLLALQDLAGTRSWTGDYNADGNSLIDLDYLEANYAILRNSYSEDDVCTTKQLGTTATGEILTCVSGRWKKPEGSPENMVSYFNSSTCPTGWVESNGINGTRDVRGAFIRSLDRGRGLDSGRTLGSYQADNGPHLNDYQIRRGNIGTLAWGSTATYGLPTNGAYTPWQATGEGGAGGDRWQMRMRLTGGETRPDNVALLACQKLP